MDTTSARGGERSRRTVLRTGALAAVLAAGGCDLDRERPRGRAASTSAGEVVAQWREDEHDGGALLRTGLPDDLTPFRRLLRDESERRAWLEELPDEGDLREQLGVEVDLHGAVAVVGWYQECANSLLVTSPAPGVLTVDTRSDHPGETVDCASSPFVVQLFRVELAAIGVESADEVELV